MTVKCSDPPFAAELLACPGQFVLAPEAVFAPKVSKHSLRIQTFMCEMCHTELPFQCFTSNSQMRMFRRLHRALSNGGETRMAHERIICNSCADKGHVCPPRCYLEKLCKRDVIQVEVETTLRIRDHSYEVIELKSHAPLGDPIQRDVDDDLNRRAANFVRLHLLHGMNEVDSVNPNMDDVNSNIADEEEDKETDP